ncbi:hypothetical protein BJX76DRAFT_97792 [Aspergillus varians]
MGSLLREMDSARSEEAKEGPDFYRAFFCISLLGLIRTSSYFLLLTRLFLFLCLRPRGSAPGCFSLSHPTEYLLPLPPLLRGSPCPSLNDPSHAHTSFRQRTCQGRPDGYNRCFGLSLEGTRAKRAIWVLASADTSCLPAVLLHAQSTA